MEFLAQVIWDISAIHVFYEKCMKSANIFSRSHRLHRWLHQARDPWIPPRASPNILISLELAHAAHLVRPTYVTLGWTRRLPQYLQGHATPPEIQEGRHGHIHIYSSFPLHIIYLL